MTTTEIRMAGRREWIGLAVLALACLLYVMPPGVPADAAAIARDTLVGAVGVAGQLPGQVGAALLDVARQAFVGGMQRAAGISAIVALGVAVLAVVMLRNVGSGATGQATKDQAPDRDTAREHAFPQTAATCVPAPES